MDANVLFTTNGDKTRTMEEITDQFLDQMETVFIPMVRSMVDKEKEHIKFLKNAKAPEHMIWDSEKWLAHYEFRLSAYIEYVEAHRNQGK